MASEQANEVKARFIAVQKKLEGTPPPTVEEMRVNYDRSAVLTAEPDGVSWEDTEVAGVPCRWAIPVNAVTDRVLQYVHGGGYVIGSLDLFRKHTGHLANAVGCRVLGVGYRLAPENPHPAALEDSVAVYKALLDEFAAEHIAISGDSAGGGLTVSTLVKLRDDGVALPACGVPLSPWVDLEGLGASMQAKAESDVLVSADLLEQMAGLFLAGQDPRDPLAAPLYADLTGLPPLYIQVGGDERLLDDSTRLATNAANAGVAVRLDVFPEMQHVFQMWAGNVPESDDAIDRIGEWLRLQLGI